MKFFQRQKMQYELQIDTDFLVRFQIGKIIFDKWQVKFLTKNVIDISQFKEK